jgi:phage major head subunit gpT-like protein
MNQTEFRDLLSTMPPLYHTLPSSPFDIDKSEALAWILSQPGFRQWVWDRARSTGRIKYDPSSGKWAGVVRRPKKDSVKIADDEFIE